jgi:hypothetical protein
MGDESKTDVNIELMEREIVPVQELHGKVSVNYAGRFDSIVINSQIENSSDIFNFTSINGKKINHQYARLSIFKDDLKDKNYLEFTAVTSHKPRNGHTNAKFRVAVIQEHKEVVSALAYVKILS